MGAGKKVLDVGCGGQPLRDELLRLGFHYTSADVQQNSSNTVDILTPIDQPLPDSLSQRGPFDFILCTEVLEHVPDWDMAFKNIFSLLAPGGRLLVTCPHFYQLHEIPHDYWRPTPFAIQYFARRVGLNILHQESAGDGWDVLGTALACVQPAATGGLFSKVLAFACDISRKAAFVLIRSPFFRRRVAGRGALYLSNIVVFERPMNA